MSLAVGIFFFFFELKSELPTNGARVFISEVEGCLFVAPVFVEVGVTYVWYTCLLAALKSVLPT